eukprot:gnl/Carplike_NY0171/737_a1019_2225.p1 GENE.gnl/Carplike_NY0171/737_a1019_2225~~gnl/Carplike_NY0171/737_a1019_2225.p1  ORF type:complete len:218 (+),score=37.97 gnl/Carplike_NY0171/737_a1019_2225:122-775(+)
MATVAAGAAVAGLVVKSLNPPRHMSKTQSQSYSQYHSTTTQWMGAQYGSVISTQEAQIQQRFVALDTDRSGFVDEGEISRGFANNGRVLPLATARKLIRLFDQGLSNGVVGIAEFKYLDAFINSIRMAFASCDPHRTGRIAYAQLSSVLQAQGFMMTPDMLLALQLGWDREKMGSVEYFDVIDCAVTLALCKTLYLRNQAQLGMTFDRYVIMMISFV